jgi:isoleucyl-tRNA synthetase
MSASFSQPHLQKFDPLAIEPLMLQFWQQNNVRQKAIAQAIARGGEKFYFLQGPPYTSGRIHLGHAWNNCLKDAILRYKRMQGFHVWDRAGYDMHGLPTESKVMAKHNLKLNRDIAEFGEEKFAIECESYCIEMMKLMNADLERLGVSMDFENAYMPISNEYMENIWKLIKRAHDTGRLYRGKRTMGWDPVFATALAKHEMEYKEFTHDSVFVKFKAVDVVDAQETVGEISTYFIIWTTTPWTLPLNLAIMVNPDLDYVKAKVVTKTGQVEYWVVAKALVGVFCGSVVGVTFEIVSEFKGEKLAGKRYTHFWSDLPAIAQVVEELSSRGAPVHSILLSSEYVELSAGTGLVHCAPGCGPEDYEVGHRNGLIPFNPVDVHGYFPTGFGEISGKRAVENDLDIIILLKQQGHLVAKSKITHEYPHGERSKAPIIFRATEQWFFRTEDLKARMLALNERIHWVPEKSKNAFRSWLDNLRDNSITKQRFWGTPAPIWVNIDDSSDYIVVGSISELTALGATVSESLHKPFIDSVTFVKNGKTYRRIPDVLDVWIDAGSASFNCLNTLPESEFREWFPADFILEGKDQIRGWFNLLMVASTIMYDEAAFEHVYVHGFIAGIDGQKMSKSLGNVISPFEVVDTYGSDTLRYYTSKIRAGEDIAWSWDEVKQHYRNLSILHNVGNFMLELAKSCAIDATSDSLRVTDSQLAASRKLYGAPEKYMLSKTHSALKRITMLYDGYELHLVASVFEEVLLELSRTYIQAVRDKASDEPEVVLSCLLDVLELLLPMAYPIVPFMTEYWYGQLRRVHVKNNTKGAASAPCADEVYSLMYGPFPKYDESCIDVTLETDFALAGSALSAILACREKLNRGVRFPIGEVVLSGPKFSLTEYVCTMANVKSLSFKPFEGLVYSVSPNHKNLGREFGSKSKDVILALSALSSHDAHALAKELTASGSLTFAGVTLTCEHVVISQHIPEGFVSTSYGIEGQSGHVIMHTTFDPLLDVEGYARELIRRIQSARKSGGYHKQQTLSAVLYLSDVLCNAYMVHEELILKRCGLSSVSIHKIDEVFDETLLIEKIKDESLSISLRE